MDFFNILVTVALAMGIFTADAVLNADNITLNLQVGSDMEDRGYTKELVETVFMRRIEEITDSESFMTTPRLRTVDDETLVSLIADWMGLDQITTIIQKTVSIDTITLVGGLVEDGNDQVRFLMHGSSPVTGDFELSVPKGDRTVDRLLSDAAFLTAERLEPYLTLLYRFRQRVSEVIGSGEPLREGDPLDDVVRTIDERLAALAATPGSAFRRALYLNLRGMTRLMGNRTEDAARGFTQAAGLAPELGIPQLNLAFTRVHQGRYTDAIAIVRRLVDGRTRVAREPPLRAAAFTTWGVSAWELDDVDTATARFRQAQRIHRQSAAAFDYHAEMLAKLGQTDQAAVLRAQAMRNLRSFETYPEVAMLHMRLTTEANQPLTVIRPDFGNSVTDHVFDPAFGG